MFFGVVGCILQQFRVDSLYSLVVRLKGSPPYDLALAVYLLRLSLELVQDTRQKL